jgi:hypothetical protein
MLIKYFYVKALKDDPSTNPDDFRYPGPKPQTKENAILMLADGVEATVRAMAQAGALDKPIARNSDASESPGLYENAASLPDDVISEVVHKTISERIEDGQLDECDLTVRDIARIQEAFVSMLKGIYHPRVQYPEAPGRRTTDDSSRMSGVPSEPRTTHRPTTDDEQPAVDGQVPDETTAVAAVRVIPDGQDSVLGNVFAVGTNGSAHNGTVLGGDNDRRSMSGAQAIVGRHEEEVAHE